MTDASADRPGDDATPPPTGTREALVAAATELFAELGYSGTSIGDLARRIGLTTASLYHHVSGKQELLLHVLDARVGPWLGSLEPIAAESGDPRERVRRAVDNHLNFMIDNVDAMTVFMRDRRHLETSHAARYQTLAQRYQALFIAVLREAVDAGRVIDGDPELYRLAVFGMVGGISVWPRPYGPAVTGEVRRAFTAMIMNQLLADPAA